MSVYNGEQWLSESIKSVLRQTHQDFEFIIINDGSKDSTAKLIKIFESKDPRIRVIDKPNTGLTNSLNLGIGYARGDWIARIDCDDLCEPDRLEKQYALAQNNNLVLIGSGAIEIDSHGHSIQNYSYPQSHQSLVRRLILNNRGFFSHSSAFIRTKTVRRLGGYCERFKRAQDYDLWLRMSALGEIGCHKNSLVRIRRHARQITNENEGKRQKIDSRAALVSYLLRQQSQPDPAGMESPDAQFEEFWRFIQHGVEKSNLVLFRQFINKVKKMWINPRLEKKYFACKIALSNPAFLFRYFKEIIFGERLAVKLCRKWMNQSKK